ncbi:hypothetical protein HMPREF9123_2753 [Neisseria bacilliformis ATCC BAA-1200]|uniref:Uncharacterized protein n=1 Tax=Neisseria bacilliformis ATCC BAA-1200 TaxID=888742 RepID=F2BG96_9NEIS|nr:hypothetical protein HMPREF9123_2753 [Neisseria bacilliformis ATCC BAA-1200]
MLNPPQRPSENTVKTQMKHSPFSDGLKQHKTQPKRPSEKHRHRAARPPHAPSQPPFCTENQTWLQSARFFQPPTTKVPTC